MALPNGLATPPKQHPELEPSSGTKRKRTGSNDKSSPRQSLTRPAVDASTIADVYEVISSHDAAPAILNFPIDSEDEADDAHAAKRSRTEDAGPTTVSRKVADGAYGSLQELESDIKGICVAQIASLKEPDEEEDSKATKRLSGDDVAQMQDIMSFELFVKDVVRRENDLAQPASQTKQETANGIKKETTSQIENTVPAAGRTVLSLFGNAPTPRQLFSSLQEDAATDISLQELGLPTMLVATKLLPTPKNDARSQSRRTIGELFAPPSTLATLQPPPKPTRLPSYKATSISFLPPDKSIAKPSRKGSYTVQPLTTGKWLRYGSRQKAPSKASKEHSKGRSVSSIDLVEKQHKEPLEEDLFTSAYSSFAPARDDSRAIIPADVCDLIWWQKIGKRKTSDIFASDLSHDEMEIDVLDDDETRKIEEEHELQIYKELVDNFDEEDMSLATGDENPSPADMEAEDLLSEISELLRTLASHQRIRHSILPTSARGPSSPSPLRNAMVGTPTEPSKDESATYSNLRDHLANLIARLPPYLVAKLNGAQVEDLAISRTILVEGKNGRGVMEEDQATRTARGVAAAAAAAVSSSSSSTTRPSSSQQFNQYSRWAGLSNNRSALTPQTTSRGPISYGRSSSGLAATTPVQPNRQAYGQAGSYTAPVNRTALQPTYGQAGSQQYYSQRPTYGQQALGQGSSQTQSQARPGQHSVPSQQQYQSQSQRYSDSASYNHNLNTFQQVKLQNQQRLASSPNAYSTPARPGSNGRSTPVANIAPAIPQHHNSPVKLAAASAPRPSSVTPQPQTNGV